MVLISSDGANKFKVQRKKNKVSLNIYSNLLFSSRERKKVQRNAVSLNGSGSELL
jgi:hypothetical protein